MTSNRGRKRARPRIWPRVLVGVICAGVVLATLGLVLFTYRPAGYRPPTATPDEAVNTYLTHELAPAFYNNVQIDEPFEVIVDQEKFNQLVADGRDLGWAWPVTLNGVTFSSPVVRFYEGRVALMGQVDVGIPIVVTVEARPELDDKGLLVLNLEKVKAGAVNVTRLAKSLCGQIMAAQAVQLEDSRWLRDLAGACLENRPYDPRFPVPPCRKYIRLTGFDLIDRQLRLRFEPAGTIPRPAASHSRWP